jgi:hypothetical protein
MNGTRRRARLSTAMVSTTQRSTLLEVLWGGI